MLADLAYSDPSTKNPADLFRDLPIDIEAVFFLETHEDAELYTIVLPHALVFLSRGTESMKDVKTDVMVLKKRFPEVAGAKVHRGFAKQFASVRDTIVKYVSMFVTHESERSVVFIGHSLGGALSTLGAAYIKSVYPRLFLECVTFGSPRVGNRAFAEWFNTNINHHARFVHGNDLITRMPRINYAHVGNKRVVGPPTRSGCLWRFIGDIRDHSMKTYIKALYAGFGSD
jgi:hypothetical protein